MPDWSIASSATFMAMRSPSSVEQNGSTGMKSTVPAIVVLSPSLGKRVMRWMPDSPAVSFVQLSALPAPSEVMMPMPVTTTTGRPFLSCADVMPECSSRRRSRRLLDPSQTFAAPLTDGDSVERPFIRLLDCGSRRRRKQLFATECQRGKRNIQRQLRLEAMAEAAAGRPHRHAGQALQERTFLGGRRFRAGHAGYYRGA